MTSHYIPALALLLAAPLAQAQKPRPTPTDPVLRRILAEQAARATPAAKTQATQYRLTGYSYRELGGPVRDSFRLWYSGTHGSPGLASKTWDEYAELLDYAEEGGDYIEDRTDYPRADSIVHRISTGLVVHHSDHFTYNSAGNLLTGERKLPAGSPARCSRFEHGYGTGTTLASASVSFSPVGQCGAYQLFNKQTYNPAGLLLTDSNESMMTRYYYSPSGRNDSTVITYPKAAPYTTYNLKFIRTVSVYNAAGLLVRSTGILNDSLHTVADTSFTSFYYYDALGRLDSSTLNRRNISYTKNVYQYTGTFTRPTLLQWYSAVSPTQPYQLMAQHGYHVNAAGNYDTVYYYDVPGGAAVPSERGVVWYRPDGTIDRVQGYRYDGATGQYQTTPYDLNQYSYEAYSDVTGVADVPAPSEVTAYPNPFREALRVETTGTWSVADAMGRLLGSGSGPATINTAAWPAGLYLLRTTASSSKLMKH